MKKFNEVGAGFSMLIPFLNTWYLYTISKELDKSDTIRFINSKIVLIFGLIYNILYVSLLIVLFVFDLDYVPYMVFSVLFFGSFICHILLIVGGCITLSKINNYYQQYRIAKSTSSSMIMFIFVGGIIPPVLSIIWFLIAASITISPEFDLSMQLDVFTDLDLLLMGVTLGYVIISCGCCVFAFYKLQKQINNFIDEYNSGLSNPFSNPQMYNQNVNINQVPMQ